MVCGYMKGKVIPMKKFASLCLIAAMMVSMSSCASESGSAAAGSTSGSSSSSSAASETESTASSGSGDTIELTYWYAWTDKIQENNENLVAQFNETVGAEKGIHVTAEYQGTYDDVHQKLQAAYVAGDTPDVTVMEIGSVGTFARNGVLQPLDEYF